MVVFKRDRYVVCSEMIGAKIESIWGDSSHILFRTGKKDFLYEVTGDVWDLYSADTLIEKRLRGVEIVYPDYQTHIRLYADGGICVIVLDSGYLVRDFLRSNGYPGMVEITKEWGNQ